MGVWLGGLVVGGMGGCERRLESIGKCKKVRVGKFGLRVGRGRRLVCGIGVLGMGDVNQE